MKRLASNFFSLSVLQAFTYVLPLFTIPYLLKVLGADNFGLVMFGQAFLMFFNVLVDYGFNLYATKEVALYRDDADKRTEIYSSVMSLKAVLLLVAVSILTIIVFSFEKLSNDWELYYLTFVWVVGQAYIPVWFFQGIEQMKYITLVNVVSKLIFTLLIFIVVKDEADYLAVPIVNGVGALFGACMSIWIVKVVHRQRFSLCSPIVLKAHLTKSTQFFLSRFSVSIYSTSNVFIIGLATNNEMVGYYSIAEKFYQVLQQIYHPVVNALYPYMSKERNIKLFKRLFWCSVFVNGATVVGMFLIGDYVFGLLFPAQINSRSIDVLHVLLIANLVLVPSMLLGYPFLAALGYERQANLSVFGGSVLHLMGLGSIYLFSGITIYTVGLMVLATEIFILLTRIHWIRSFSLWSGE